MSSTSWATYHIVRWHQLFGLVSGTCSRLLPGTWCFLPITLLLKTRLSETGSAVVAMSVTPAFLS